MDTPPQIRILQAETDAQIAAVRELFTEYRQLLGVDLSFQAFADELASLPGAYAPPSGRLLLAIRDDVYAGCVALRAWTADDCEMKRLYVRPAFRRQGLGRRLVTEVIAQAVALGYKRMCLDTLPNMERAQDLYRSFGFQEIPPYRFNPVPGARYMALALQRS
ncbi:MAG TPA: GNAT family N-acetyltransferase [Phycisphaerae bacterium]|nr:GNAT family N-acetyltransferase [Phycisphaerae bacterium]